MNHGNNYRVARKTESKGPKKADSVTAIRSRRRRRSTANENGGEMLDVYVRFHLSLIDAGWTAAAHDVMFDGCRSDRRL